LAWVAANVSIAGNHTSKLASSSVRDFSVLKKFNVCIHPPKVSSLKEVIWQPPLPNWVKCNTDGAFTGLSASCGGIFRNSSAFQAELCGVMTAIEIAASKDWNNLWLETDSSLVVLAFKNGNLVPWWLSN
jgi:hypothetical protein